jgi:4-amino-4-deoxy-L-arabinose transferase-like glycosyltransferase
MKLHFKPSLGNLLTRSNTILLVITVIGAFLRCMAYIYNDIPHGDINLDYAAAQGFMTNGRLVLPYITSHPYLNAQLTTGYPLDQHAPLWPLLGGLGAMLGENIYTTFKLVSLLAGILLIPLSYLALRKAYGELPALFASACIAISYILIDFSGNGSLYELHALLFMFFVLLIQTDHWLRSILLGILIGMAYLLNYQAVVTPLTLLLVYILRYGIGRKLLNAIPFLLASLVSALFVISPWLIRNLQVFGHSLFSVNIYYFLSKLDAPTHQELISGFLVTYWQVDQISVVSAFPKILFWTARNLTYFLGRIIILAPVVAVFVPWGAYSTFKQWRNHRVTDASLAIPALLGAHLAISCLWPVFKFRYFVPLMPLLIGLGAYGIFSVLHQSRVLIPVLTTSLAAFLLVGGITYVRVPTHTNYYDSNEFFHYRVGESEWQITERAFQEVALVLAQQPPGAVIGPISVIYYTHHLAVSNPGDPEMAKYFIGKHSIKYILDESSRKSFYDQFLRTNVIYGNNSYILLAIQGVK